ncbi:epoxide hydrolase family protein [Pendulispora albinea]|uniref:Epoxide hydrolase n=1 Tax=Pendulispora albinea TaxID=2741071 RepID=A0ABZ2M293_9BACT
MIERFSIHVDEPLLDDLRARIEATRWPDQIPDVGWTQGTERAYLRTMLAYWGGEFDWRAQERWLNTFPHFMWDGIHFVHVRAREGRGLPLILTHGWPSCFAEYLALVRHLDAFDLVIPSLPGYGFSPRPPRLGVNYRFVADRWHALMQELGYSRYGAGGGDFGAGVASFLAMDHPESVIGLHLTTMELSAPHDAPGLSEAERSYVAEKQRWLEVEYGYSALQSTKPQSLGYALNDSPAGLAAWLLEKWHSWTGTMPSNDFLCTLLTIYWATETITSSMRDYYDNRFHGVQPTFVDVPTAFGVFPCQTVTEGEPPREFAERLYRVQRWTTFDRGGHFAAIEQPDLVAADIAEFFRDLQS